MNDDPLGKRRATLLVSFNFTKNDSIHDWEPRKIACRQENETILLSLLTILFHVCFCALWILGGTQRHQISRVPSKNIVIVESSHQVECVGFGTDSIGFTYQTHSYAPDGIKLSYTWPKIWQFFNLNHIHLFRLINAYCDVIDPTRLFHSRCLKH